MLLTLSAPLNLGPRPGDVVKRIAGVHNCYARLKWETDFEIRFQLVEHRDSYVQALPGIQSKVIRALLEQDPGATIKTAKAIYRGLIDYNAQIRIGA